MHNLAKATHPTWTHLWQKTLWSLFLVGWCVILGAAAAWATTDFVVLGHDGIWVRQGSTVVSGDVGANEASFGPFLAGDQEVTIGKNVVVQDPTSRVQGDTMRLKSGSQVYDVFMNTLKGSGQILGELTTPVDLPLVSAFPLVSPVTPGVQDLDVPIDGMLALDAGSYGLLKVSKRAILTLTGGLYHFRKWDIRAEAKVYAAAPVEIRVSEHLRMWSETVVGPVPTAPTLTAADVRIIGTGVNGTTGAISATPKAVQFGVGSHVRANVYAPNGTLWVKQRSTATGAFVGKWVRMGNGGTITLEGGFGLGTGGGNTAPVANAGPNQTVQITNTVRLDGSDSTDVNGDLLTYSWTLLTQPDEGAATLDDATSVMPMFAADASGSYEIELIVDDGHVASDPDTVTITTINSPPVANAGQDQTVFVTQAVLLDGTNSSDVDGDGLNFLWSFVTIPSESTAILSDPTSSTPNFTVDFPGTYEIQLLVNDGMEGSAPDLVIINTQNSKPVANAELDQVVPIGSTVQLDGSNSSDVDGDPLTFTWALIAVPTGSTASLSNAMLGQPTFVADLPGIYVAEVAGESASG
ncbi:MAG: PKD domain-containing protein [Nitrospirales bacterium]